MSTDTDLDKNLVLAHILDGRFDEEALTDIQTAITKRIIDGQTARRWTLEWDGITVTEDDLLIEEAADIEAATKLNWSQIEPLNSAAIARAILAARLKHGHGLSPEAVKKRLAKARVSDIVDGAGSYFVDPAPKEFAG